MRVTGDFPSESHPPPCLSQGSGYDLIGHAPDNRKPVSMCFSSWLSNLLAVVYMIVLCKVVAATHNSVDMHCTVPHGCGANHTVDKEAVQFITSFGADLKALETSLQVWQPVGSTSTKWFRHSLLDHDVNVISDMVRGRFFPGV